MRDLTMRSVTAAANGTGANDQQGWGALIGDSAAMRGTVARLRRIAERDTTVLLEGESGTGKELAAQAIHADSPRRRGPFVVVDCRANPRGFVDEDLFESAQGGTIFLDEIGELDLLLQPRLLRLVENRRIRLVDTRIPRDVDFRIIAATSHELARDTAQGTFRADLYYRLAVNNVRLPPLSERVQDIPLLWRHFCKELTAGGETDYLLDDQAIEALSLRPWPGNVRELRNAVERVATFGPEALTATMAPPVTPWPPPPNLPAPVVSAPAPADAAASPSPANTTSPHPTGVTASFHTAKATILAGFERDFLTKILARHEGNITAAAAAAGLDRVHFLRLLDRYGLRKPRV